ncbi:asparagine synthase [Spiractinospora alimapuensis]|nr:albusnodin/ikarugamycin family macrolactam cyclase [Spiractinospora alimapuensis]QVQ54037.1 asparagine synthase [Spiractinospora alimapuensis]
MRWFGGCVTSTPGVPSYVPEQDVSLVWEDPFPLWMVGEWSPDEIVFARSRSREAVLVGVCSLTRGELVKWLDSACLGGLPPWPGIYTVVVRDACSITVWTDPTHAAPLYYTNIEGGVVWASSSRALAAIHGSGLDLNWLGAMVCEPPIPPSGQRSAFADVDCIPPGYRMMFTRGKKPMAQQWWFAPNAVSSSEAATGFRWSLEKSVLARTTTVERISCDLSGGLDSTTLCLLAAGLIEVDRRVTGLTVRPASTDSGGDLDHARTVAFYRHNIRHSILGLTGEALPYSELEEIPPCDEPAPSTITTARHRVAYERLVDEGSQRHLTGDGGDALLIPPSAYLYELAHRARFVRLARDVHGWAKLADASPWPRVRELFVTAPDKRASPPWASNRAQELALDYPAWGAPDTSMTNAYVISDVRSIARTANADTQIAHSFGIHLDAPFMDRTVMDAALRFRLNDRGSPWQYKPQITDAFSDILPRNVRQRHTKGGTDVDHHHGLRAHLGPVKSLMDGWLAGHSLIQPSPMYTALDRAAIGLPSPFGEFEPAIALEAWARAVTAALPVKWTRAFPAHKATP